MRPIWDITMGQPPPGPPVTDHPFDPYPEGMWPTCAHITVDGGVRRPCDRPETEHAPAPEAEAGT